MGNRANKGAALFFKLAQLAAGLLLVLMPLTYPLSGSAAEFTAQMVLKDNDKTMPGKIFVKGDKMRQEFIDERGQSVTIVRKDKKKIWVVMPQDKVYLELPFKGELPGQFLALPADGLKKRQVCTESVSGYSTKRIQVTVPGGSAGPMIQTYWMCEKLGMPLKMECREKRFSVEYRDIKEALVEDKLFEPPPGYQKITTPAGLR
jgi:outer membrane lipoprotein-sorting protein